MIPPKVKPIYLVYRTLVCFRDMIFLFSQFGIESFFASCEAQVNEKAVFVFYTPIFRHGFARRASKKVHRIAGKHSRAIPQEKCRESVSHGSSVRKLSKREREFHHSLRSKWL